MIGTIFAVALAFVMLLALQSYQRAREGASVETVAITELHSVAGVFKPLVPIPLWLVPSHPYADTGGTIKPTEMHRTLTLIDQRMQAPCDERGRR